MLGVKKKSNTNPNLRPTWSTQFSGLKSWISNWYQYSPSHDPADEIKSQQQKKWPAKDEKIFHIDMFMLCVEQGRIDSKFSKMSSLIVHGLTLSHHLISYSFCPSDSPPGIINDSTFLFFPFDRLQVSWSIIVRLYPSSNSNTPILPSKHQHQHLYTPSLSWIVPSWAKSNPQS